MRWKVGLAVLATSATALADAKKVDSATTYAGFALRGKVPAFGPPWRRVDSRRKPVMYESVGRGPAFLGVAIDTVVVGTSPRLGLVVGFTLAVDAPERCAQLAKALSAAWGPPVEVGGPLHETAWRGDKVDASLDHADPRCFLALTAHAYDDETDDWATK